MINVNEYFDGAVKSLGYQTAEGQSTLGVISKGEYEFGTSMHEKMTIIEGILHALLPDSDGWKAFNGGETFEVPANSSFKVKAEAPVAYLCQYR